MVEKLIGVDGRLTIRLKNSGMFRKILKIFKMGLGSDVSEVLLSYLQNRNSVACYVTIFYSLFNKTFLLNFKINIFEQFVH